MGARRRVGFGAALLVGALLAGCGGGGGHLDVGSLSATPVPTRTPAAGTPAPAATLAPGTRAATLGDLNSTVRRAPAAVTVPSIGIAGAKVVAVGTDPATNELTVPHNATTVVWWQGGARPGDPTGTTVLAAHVDWNGVDGVFFRLSQLAVGAQVTVRDGNGVQHRYRVVARRHVAKPELAGQDLFRTDGPARLALVTCGGQFDSAKHSYKDNVVVVAVPLAA